MRYIATIKTPISLVLAVCALLLCTALVFTPVNAGATTPIPTPTCPAPSVLDNSVKPPICRTPISANGLPHSNADSAALKTIRGIVNDVIGALALLMITVSGLRYITSAGDPQKASKAKNGIVFALVGVLIAIIANAIVAFVVNGL